ncbi:putative arabinan endo-1,5-alpha-L-arabinosidase C [Staphylotrichum tortipilum]|uniref:Arabinan endo-1,5-alpha-L-arabinosidase C n=1 Tax=Staphylotrichum tortipilum TaxID=2831512 RepID=A0AAN6RUJ1_9PEZI|nr:putative arabinan endo-1,5-alpha-L-arabinosidase C [Staphylotrichum longicolle]
MIPLLIPAYFFFVLVLHSPRARLPVVAAAVAQQATTGVTADRAADTAAAAVAATSTTTTAAAATATATRIPKSPLLNIDFPDPCVVRDPGSGSWYAFATGGWTAPDTRTNATTNETTIVAPTYINIQAAARSFAWSLVALTPSSFVMYYAAQLPGNRSRFHCIGAATSPSILGPYTPLPTPLACPVDRGGAIDPAGFKDPRTGKRYLLYKVDGNAVGEGGECNNGVEPAKGTPIVMQEVDGGDGVTLRGEGVEVWDRDAAGGDGPLVEAPDLVYDERHQGGRYVLFYSNHCFDGPGYSVNYAVSVEGGNVTGPYERGGLLVGTGDGFNVTAPGGAASAEGAGWMVFHGDCPSGRCLFGAGLEVDGKEVIVS